jgi:hypothetical protein
MRRIVTLGGILTLLLLVGLSAMGEDSENAVNSEDQWAALDTDLNASNVEVKDISGKYADLTRGFYIMAGENVTTATPVQVECIWTIEQHGSLLLGTAECTGAGWSYQIMGSTTMEDVHILYMGTHTEEGVAVTEEGILDGEILESGEIVLNGVGSAYGTDLEEVYYFAETTVLTPIDE